MSDLVLLRDSVPGRPALPARDPLAAALAAAGDAMAVLDEAGERFLAVNDTFLAAVGVRREGVIGYTVAEAGVMEDRAGWRRLLAQAGRGVPASLVHDVRVGAGAPRRLELRLAAGGEGAERRHVLVARPLPPLPGAPLAERLAAVVYVDGLEPERPLYASPQLGALLGTVDAAPAARDAAIHEGDRVWVLAERGRARSAGEDFAGEHRLRTAGGDARWVLVHESPADGWDGPARVGLVMDVSAPKAVERGLRETLARVVDAQEEERRRIADEVHDESVQVLAAALMRLQMLAGRGDDGRRRGEIERTIQGSLDRLRALLADLRPAALDHAGLAGALRGTLAAVCAEAGADGRLDDRLAAEPPEPARTLAFRAARDVLADVAARAGVRRVDVVVEGRDGGVAVRVCHDGAADDPPAPPGLRERVESAGGRLRACRGRRPALELWLPAARV